MMAECGTCASLKNNKEMHKRENEPRIRYKYYARILERSERDLNLSGKWSFAGDYTWYPSPLNYCPECGKKVK